MILYHGTDCDFSRIDLGKSCGRRDFGVGFYTTTLCAQAENWAKSKRFRNMSTHAYVYVFEYEPAQDLDVKIFEGLSIEWLEMIKANRKLGGTRHAYDVVIGPVANDDTMVTVNRYVQGIYTSDEAIGRLRFSKANDQVSFHTERAVSCLTLLRRYEVE